MSNIPSVLRPDTLSPLPDVLRKGLTTVASFALLSLIASGTLFLYLTYRLGRWYWKGQLSNGANQFLLLIYSLLLADIQQAVAFSLTVTYVAKDKIEVGTTTCWVNGWFVSTGDLASSVFIFSIALHTFFATVKGRSLSNKIFYAWIAGAWAFVYVMAIIGVGLNPDLYVRAGAWCWVNRDMENVRLWLHYFWIFLCMFGTIVVYALIFISLMTKSRHFAESTIRSSGSEPAVLKRAAKYMIIYPTAYVICTLPLAGGRMAAMTGVVVPYWWFCVAGSMISSCGWIDVLLYVMTRRVLVFSRAPPPREDFGLDTLGWKHGGLSDNFWGTTTTIEGPSSNQRNRGKGKGILGWRTARPLPRRHSDEDYFASPREGVVTVKTTVEVTSGIIPQPYADSDFSAFEMDDKAEHGRTPSSPAEV